MNIFMLANLLTLVFIVCDVVGQIDWPWWKIIMPTICAFIIALLLSFCSVLIELKKSEKAARQRRNNRYK